MTLRPSPTAVLTQVADSLVAKHRYATIEEALWELALAAVRSKTTYYRRRVRKLENKYAMSFDKLTAHLKNQATPTEEDDWLAWRSAQTMLDDWHKAYQDLLHARPRG